MDSRLLAQPAADERGLKAGAFVAAMATFVVGIVATTYGLTSSAAAPAQLYQAQAVRAQPRVMSAAAPHMQAPVRSQMARYAAEPRLPMDTDASVQAGPMSWEAPAVDVAASNWAITCLGMGSMVTAAALYMWHRVSSGKSQESWAMAAYDPTEDFPGPGNPEDEHEVTIVWQGEETNIKIKGDQSILMACEEAGYEMPYLCRNGVCLTCTGKVVEGLENARKDSQCHNEDNIRNGYICTCSTYIGGEGVKVVMGMQEEAYKAQFGRFEAEEKEREAKKKRFGLF